MMRYKKRESRGGRMKIRDGIRRQRKFEKEKK